jgi:hypothetical protein
MQGVGNIMNNDYTTAATLKETGYPETTPETRTTLKKSRDDHTKSAGSMLESAANGAFSLFASGKAALDMATEAATGAAMSLAIKAKVGTVNEATHKPLREATLPRNAVDDIVDRLETVEKRMNEFRAFIQAQKDLGKPLHEWNTYGGYPVLGTAVSELEKSTAKFKRARIPKDRLAASIARANHYSTSVSRAAVDILAMINTKAEDYMDEMETSTLNEDAKNQTNALIIEEVQKLIEHSTRAAEHVWRATDLLRACKERRIYNKDWTWSAAATAMTAFIAATVGIAATQVNGPSIPSSTHNMLPQILDIVERTQTMTNLTSQIYNIKLQNIDQRYTDLSALSKSHSIRIDKLVEALGPPNSEGTYYGSMPKTTEDSTCGARLQKVSMDLGLQLQRQQENLAQMRKDMNRMGLRLTQKVEQLEKKKYASV